MAFVLPLLLSSLLAFSLCSGAAFSNDIDPEILIAGGFETSITENRWQVALLLGSGKIYHCGGSIIGEDWALTAAHCVEDYEFEPEYLTVRAGSSYWRKGGLKVEVEEIHVHHKYEGRDYDFALIKLAEPLDLDSFESIEAIELPSADAKIADDTHCRVTGWGNTSGGYWSQSSEILRQAEINIFKQKECKKLCNNAHACKSKITDREICAGDKEGKRDSCSGDSGGPMTCEVNNTRLLVGVVQEGMGQCAKRNEPGIYGRVSAVREWINEISGI